MKQILSEKSWTIFTDFQAEAVMTEKGTENQIVCHRISLTVQEDISFVKNHTAMLTFSFPMTDICGRWHPTCGFDRAVKANWSNGVPSMAAISAPVMCFYNADGENRHTIAVSEVKQKVLMNCGIREEDGMISCRVSVELPEMKTGSVWSVEVWESMRNDPWWDTLRQVREWWEEVLQLKPMEVPEAGHRPMYSFWYSQHQDINENNVEQQSKLAKELGFSAVIVDDGWQTDDIARGYAFCGDWEPEKSKFPDFAAHIRRVQGMGIKYLLWLSVPFIGIRAKNWEQFKDKILRYDAAQEAGILDLRYPDVRAFLKQVYCRAISEWKLDGLKMDFIDEFYMSEESPVFEEGMDFADIQDALDYFLTDVANTLKGIRSDILIEFRQRYIGPQIRKYGNLFRVNDCPGSGITNRIGTVDLRLLSGNTGVHSDMLMWHPDERTEEAVLQIQNCIFSTMQFSVDPQLLSEEKIQALRFWMNFMEAHTDLLQKSQIRPSEPEHLYPEVRASLNNEEVLVHYSKGRVADLQKSEKNIYYIHATKQDETMFRLDPEKNYQWQVRNCLGEIISDGIWEKQVWESLAVPTGGMVELQSKN